MNKGTGYCDRSAEQRETAHGEAAAEWDSGRERSRASGLGERLRAEKSPRPYRLGLRAAQQRTLHKRLTEDHARNVRREPYRAGRSRYWPHQSTREMARRVRQMEAQSHG